jgi:hypothetical protein
LTPAVTVTNAGFVLTPKFTPIPNTFMQTTDRRAERNGSIVIVPGVSSTDVAQVAGLGLGQIAVIDGAAFTVQVRQGNIDLSPAAALGTSADVSQLSCGAFVHGSDNGAVVVVDWPACGAG